MSCICQRAYDTGLTGIPKLDAKLEGHYNHSVERDAIKRSYDHYHFGIPYVESTAQPPYCFTTRTVGHCNHPACDYARHRPSKIVAQMRFYIESICEAAVHYPDLEERIDRHGDQRPEMDNTAHILAQWDEREFQLLRSRYSTPRTPRWINDVDDESTRRRLAKRANFSPPKGEQRAKLQAIPLEAFREEVECVVIGWGDEDLWHTLPTHLQAAVTADEAIVATAHSLGLASTAAAQLAANALLDALNSDAPTYEDPTLAQCGVRCGALPGDIVPRRDPGHLDYVEPRVIAVAA